MPIRFRCPNGHRITAGEKLIGLLVKCPTCDTNAKVPKPKGPAKRKSREVERREQEKQASEIRREEISFGLGKVDTGLTIHYWKFVGFLAGFTLYMAAGAAWGFCAGVFETNVRILADLIFLAVLVNFLVLPIAGAVGSGLCLAMPDRKARRFIFVSLFLDLLAVVFGVVLVLRQVLAENVAEAFCAFWILSAWGLFMLFLRRLAQRLRDKPRTREPIYLFIWGAMIVATFAGLFGFEKYLNYRATSSLAESQQFDSRLYWAVLFYLFLLITWFVFFFRYIFRILRLIEANRENIDDALASN